MRTLLYVSWAIVQRAKTEQAIVNEAGVTAMVQGGKVRSEAGMMDATCCGKFQSAGEDAETELCIASRPPLYQGHTCDELPDKFPALFPHGVADMGDCGAADLDVLKPCVNLAERVDADARTETAELHEGESEEDADAGVGDSCDSSSPNSCGEGLVCSRGVCKYAAMEICKPAGWFSASRCASHPYGSGHKFQCKTHRTWGDKRCCIPGGSKHFGEAEHMLNEQRPLTQKQYEAAHPGRVQTKDGKSIKRESVEEPKAYLTNYRTRRVPGQRFRREIVPGTGTMVLGKEKILLTNACCSGWATYGREGVVHSSPAEQKAEKVWFCGY